MTCQEVQAALSLYLYGELDFANEEALEAHLVDCSFCQLTLNREKNWHATLNTGQMDVPLNLLASCRNDLKMNCQRERGHSLGLWRLLDSLANVFDVRTTKWSSVFAVGSMLVMLGFGAGRMANHFSFSAQRPADMADISFPNSPVTRIQNVRPTPGNRVTIMVEQVRNGEISGSPDDERVRELLLSGARNSLDPGIRVDAVEMLTGQNSEDVRDALISSVENDPNAAVRMKALEGLRQFSNDTVTRDALKFVLSHDRDSGVRSEAIDVLVPADRSLTMTPELLQTLQDLVRAGQDDDYVHTRCLQVLQGAKAQADAY